MKLICNPATYAGKALKRWPSIFKALKEAGLDFEVEWTKSPYEAIKIAKESVKEHDILVSYGGDGTITEVLTGIAQTGFKATLGVIPVGRGNDDAFNLRQTTKIDDVIEMLIEKKTRLVDCIEVDDGVKYCIGVAGTGLDGVVAERTYRKSNKIVYTLALIRAILSYRPRHMRIDIDDGKIVRDQKCLLVIAGNGRRVGANKMVTPNAIIDDGLLDVMICGDTGVIDTLITSAKLGKGTHIYHPKVEVLRGKKVYIENKSDKRIPSHAMGELLGPLPHKFVCIHKKLKVLRMSDAVLERAGWTHSDVFLENVKKGK